METASYAISTRLSFLTIRFYDDPFFGRWPALTSNNFGSGTLLYEGRSVRRATGGNCLEGAPRPPASRAPTSSSPPACVLNTGAVMMAGISTTTSTIPTPLPL